MPEKMRDQNLRFQVTTAESEILIISSGSFPSYCHVASFILQMNVRVLIYNQMPARNNVIFQSIQAFGTMKRHSIDAVTSGNKW